MTAPIDPTVTLASFQQAVQLGQIQLERGAIDPQLYVHMDQPVGNPGLTYALLEGETVTAFVQFLQRESIEGTPSFNIGLAVPKAFREQGRGKEIVSAAIAELRRGFAHAGVPCFHIEAIVEADNQACQRVAEATISKLATPATDRYSGKPAFRYLRKVQSAAG